MVLYEIYEKWNESKTRVISQIENPDHLKLSKMKGKGYRLVVVQEYDRLTQRLGKVTFPTARTRSWEVVDLSSEEIMKIKKANTKDSDKKYWSNIKRFFGYKIF